MIYVLHFAAADWANVLLVGAGVLFVVFFLVAMVFPIFGGATASDAETPGIAARVGAMVAAVPLIAYALVWVVRGIIWILRAILCSCT